MSNEEKEKINELLGDEDNSLLANIMERTINQGAAHRDRAAIFDRSRWSSCSGLYLHGLCISEEYPGGSGLAAKDTVKILEKLGYYGEDLGLNFGIAAQLMAVTKPIATYGSDEQKNTWLPKLIAGEVIGGNAMTEESAGSDVFSMQTTAVKTETGFRLNGTKHYCTNGKEADLVLTYALTDPEKGYFGGVTAFLIDTRNQPVKWTETKEKVGLRSCPLASITFDNLEVTADQVLGEPGGGARIFEHSMNWERGCLGAIHLGAMDQLLERAAKFANQRVSGGANLSSYQAVTHPLVNLKVRLEGARHLTYQAAELLDRGEHNSPVFSMAKLSVSECYRDLCVQLMQLYAGQVYREPNLIERHLRAALAATIYSGTSEIQREMIARKIGFRPRKFN